MLSCLDELRSAVEAGKADLWVSDVADRCQTAPATGFFFRPPAVLTRPGSSEPARHRTAQGSVAQGAGTHRRALHPNARLATWSDQTLTASVLVVATRGGGQVASATAVAGDGSATVNGAAAAYRMAHHLRERSPAVSDNLLRQLQRQLVANPTAAAMLGPTYVRIFGASRIVELVSALLDAHRRVVV